MMVCTALFSSCSPTKYVPANEYLLDKVYITSDSGRVKSSEAKALLRQSPNLKIFGLFRAHLCLYSLSKPNSERKFGKLLRKMGEPPVILSPIKTAQSELEIAKYCRSKGLLNATVTSKTEYKGKKATVTYSIKEGPLYHLRNISMDYRNDTLIEQLIGQDQFYEPKIKSGDPFDTDLIDDERANISSTLQRKGYYYFNKEYIRTLADTSVGNHNVDIIMRLTPFAAVLPDGTKTDVQHKRFKISSIRVNTLDRPSVSWEELEQYDTTYTDRGIILRHKNKPFLRPSVVDENTYVRTGNNYNSILTDLTLSKFNSLGAVRSAYLTYSDRHNEKEGELDCTVTLTPSKSKSISADAEVTTTSGDFGFGANLSWTHYNIFRGSERLSGKIKYSQEAIKGLGLSDNRIRDIGAEVTLDIPRVLFPFLKPDFKRRISASTGVRLSFDLQEMGYKRQLYNLSWSYLWSRRRMYTYNFTLFDYNLVKMNDINGFREKYFNEHTNPILLYNYTDHQILCAGFAYTRDTQYDRKRLNKNCFRASIETGGNLFHVFRNAFKYESNSQGQKVIFGVPYSQYVKGEIDFSFNQFINEKSRIAYHFKCGVALPYGNSTGVPFEKRFYAGGANGVRGWQVRMLGPGEFPSDKDYIAQAGDVNLLLNIEYRIHLFWKLEFALFADAGNIWTIKKYEDQTGGEFRFDKFYKQLAFAGGAGLRFDFSYFLIRFDMGMKIHDPKLISSGTAWRMGHGMNWKDDFAIHFAVGYPF